VAITDWPLQERPRERLLALGAASLADAELLAILLRTGIQGRARRLARQLLGRFGSIGGLLEPAPRTSRKTRVWGAPSSRSSGGHGTGAPRAKEEISSRMPSRRAGGARLPAPCTRRARTRGIRGASPGRAASGHRLRGVVPRTLTQTSVYPREVVKCSLKHNAAAVIFAHNTPPAVAEPSHADEILTAP